MSSQRTSLIRWLVTAVVALALIAALVGTGLWWNSLPRYEVAAPPAVSAEDTAPALEQARSDGPTPDIAAAVARTSKDPALGQLSGQVTDLATGQVVWTSDENRPLTPASSTKVFTAAAALSTLDMNDRLETYAVQQKPGELILVGEGDVTLRRDDAPGFFTDSASVKDLAKKIEPELKGDRISRIVVDNSVREGALFNPTWDKDDVSGGNVAELDSVMLNAARVTPLDPAPPRSATPGEDVGRALAAELGLPDSVEVEVAENTPASPMTASTAGPARQTVPPGLTWLGGVESAPLDTRLRDMMIHSDNLLAESIAREVAEKQGKPRTFEGSTQATLEVLKAHGVDTDKAELSDNSGMSERNKLTAHNLDSALSRPELRSILDLLPVASAEGTLHNRFGEGSDSAGSAGWVRAKTGTLDGVNALAGTVMTEQGRALSFAFLSNGSDVTAGRQALDRLANSLRAAR